MSKDREIIDIATQVIDDEVEALLGLKKYIDEARRYKNAMNKIEEEIKKDEVLREISLQTKPRKHN